MDRQAYLWMVGIVVASIIICTVLVMLIGSKPQGGEGASPEGAAAYTVPQTRAG